jgi:CheY-like chemotaxis protein
LLGVAVEMASDGIDALARWRAGQATERHSLLLTDLHMPGIDGYTLAATIRSEEAEGARLPIVALSANALRGEIDRCRAAGMDDYLSKPVQLDQLGELLRRWLPLDDVHVPDSLHAMDCHEMDVFEIELGPMAFDDQALARLVGDDPVLLADFRQRFLLSALNTIDEMRRAASQNDMLALAGLAHRLKSSARATGAVALAVCCERIERAGPQCAAPQLHAHMAEMEDALADVMTRLGTHLGEQPSDMSH